MAVFNTQCNEPCGLGQYSTLIGWLHDLKNLPDKECTGIPQYLVVTTGGDCLTSYKRFSVPNINLIKVKSRDILTVTFKKYLDLMFHMEEDSGHIWKWISTLFITVNHRIRTFRSTFWDAECWKSDWIKKSQLTLFFTFWCFLFLKVAQIIFCKFPAV